MTLMDYEVYDQVIAMFVLVDDVIEVFGEAVVVKDIVDSDNQITFTVMNDLDEEYTVRYFDTDIVNLVMET